MDPDVSTTTAERALDEIASALRHGDVPRAQRALDAHRAEIPPHALMRLGGLNLRRRRWADAAWLLDRAAHRNAAADLQRCLARNMASLEVHRPAAYAALADVSVDADVTIGQTPSGHATII